jgi:dTDP-4-amino-4,6-dideoxygalactose transaminase
VAVPEAVLAAGATPVFFDLEPGALTSDPEHCEAALTPRTRALVVQHTFGIPADMERFAELARRRGLPLIEDCCHTYRSTWGGRAVGTFGDAAFYSFEWGKPLTVGLGGAAICNDPELKRRLASLYAAEFEEPPLARDLRITCQYYGFLLGYRPPFYWVARWLNTLLSRAGLAESSYHEEFGERLSGDFRYQMARSCRKRLVRHINEIDAITAHSEWVCGQYRTAIRNSGVQLPPPFSPANRTVFARYPLWVVDKPRVLAAARKVGVEIAGWYETPVHPLGPSEWAKVSYRAGTCPNAERTSHEVVTLPTRLRCTAKAIGRAIDLINGLRL